MLVGLVELQVRVSKGFDLNTAPTRYVTCLAVALSLAVGVVASPALAAPGSSQTGTQARVSASEASVAKAVREHAAARERLAVVDADIARNSARLDAAVTRQEQLQRRLGSRASGMYRRGRFEFIEVLTSSVSFDQFSSLWDALVRINRRDAQAIHELKQTRARIAETTRVLLRRQEVASAELRRIAAVKAKAQRELGQNRAAYAEYLRRIAAAEAADTARGSGGTSAPTAASPRPRPKLVTRPVGSGEWKTGVASIYGMGAVGHHTSSGHVIRADSMIVAHKWLPFGTLVEFEYDGRRCVASVEDRGPYYPGRMWDLGPGVSRILGIEGVETVRWRIVSR